jgi:bidirectional [NiFe] hydrogenase diaphorase subunit
VCTGTACYVKGAKAILDELEKLFGLHAGQVTPDDKLGVQTARCIGACGLAPAVVVDEEVLGKVLPGAVVEKINSKLEAV